jgi:WD40 repeat protein/serine/threonine protein kinase
MIAIEDHARSLFLAALERPAEHWPAFLDGVCGDNAELRLRVDQLLHAHEVMGSIHVGATGPAVTVDEQYSERPGAVIGAYKLLEQIGEGGFGVVFMAEQHQPIRRKVALKILKPGMDSKQVIARFEAERQALALMDHPHIAKVLDAGQTEGGRPYFVMDLVKGLPITAFCDQNQLTPRQRLELFVHVCKAVQHAHQKGIIHRDLKPSNVLVTMQDGAALVKVIDFGIAKALGQQLTDKSVFTGFAQLIGTPLYMSPEQAALSNVDVDTRSDVYSLGVLLYELLTGTTPFTQEQLQRAGYDEMRRIIREEEPPKPSTRISTLGQAATTVSMQRKSDPKRLSQLCRGEVDWIVMRSLEKDRNRRYESASAFAADVQRYLNDEPVLACPPSAWYRFGKFARKHKAALAVAGVVVAALVLGVIGLGIDDVRVKAEEQAKEQEREKKEQALNDKVKEVGRRAQAEKERADKEAERVQALQREKKALERWRQTAYYFQIALILREYQANNVARADEILDQCEPDLRRWEWYYLKRLCHSELSRTQLAGPDIWRQVAISPDGQRVAWRGGPVLLYDTTTGKELYRFTPKGRSGWGLAFSPDGKWLATNDEVPDFPTTTVHIWDVVTGKEVTPLRGMDRWYPGGPPVPPPSIGWALRLGHVQSDIGAYMSAQGGPGMALPVQLALDNQVARLEGMYLSPGEMMGVAFNPDGELAAATDNRGHLQVWERATGKMLFRRAAHPIGNLSPNDDVRVTIPVFSPDSKLVATACDQDGTFKLWDARSGDFVRSLWEGPPNKEGFTFAAFSPKGTWVAVAYCRIRSAEPSVRVWEMSLNRQRYEFRGNQPFNCLAFSPDESLLAAGNQDNSLTVWNLATGLEVATYRDHEKGVAAVAFTPDGKQVVSLSGKGVVKTWNATRGLDVLVLREGSKSNHAALSPDGRYVASASAEAGMARIWDTATGLKPLILEDKRGESRCLAFSPDGDHLAVAVNCTEALGGVKIVEAKTGRLVRTLPPQAAEPPKGKPGANLWTGAPCFAVAYSHDGKRLASGGADRMVRVWDTGTGKELFALGPHSGSVWGVAFSDDGRLVSASGGIRWDAGVEHNPLKLPGDDPKMVPDLKVWDADGNELLSLSLPGKTIALAISPDGETIAAAFADKSVRLFDTATGKETQVLRGHTGACRTVAFSPDGKRLLSGGMDQTVKMWDARTGEEILTLGRSPAQINGIGFSRDGHKIVVASQADVRVWDATPLKK